MDRSADPQKNPNPTDTPNPTPKPPDEPASTPTPPAPTDTSEPHPPPPAPADGQQPTPAAGPDSAPISPALADASGPLSAPPAPADGRAPAYAPPVRPVGPESVPAPSASSGGPDSVDASAAGTDDSEPPPGPPAPDGESRAGGAGGKARNWIRRARRLALAAILLLLLPLLIAETALRINYTGDPRPGTHTRSKDAIWLGHAWVDGRKTDADVTALAARLADTGIRDLYVHAGPLEHNGTLPKSAYPKARWLITAVHRKLPGVRVQAWLGDELAPEKPDAMHLERSATRAAVVESARQVVAAGFDGVHFDLEPLHSGDRNYLALLDALRPVTPLLSVAAHQIDPLPAFHSFWGTVTGHPKWWSQEYFGQVARRVDQIAVMSYDTMQPLQSLYGGYVAQQTSLALQVTPPGTDLLMGLPFYHENRFGHWAHAETVPAAVRGVRLGLSRTDADRANFGVALYVDFAATEDDWTSYRKDWVRTS
ncbi:glycosyl hydrolase family 18 (putative chitinase) [Streptomyces sp. Ag109_O5-1]|nr:glycosyl hydrolase family 18 (putative chitinase) [Streptomyces sp. Ag109_O5-1]